MIKTLNTVSLINRLSHPRLVLIDVREPAAFNGWKTNGEHRGGRIPGAVNFPHSWLKQLDEMQTSVLLETKGVTQDHSIVAYGYRIELAQDVVDRLDSLGFSDVQIYREGLNKWAKKPALPMERLPGYRQLVYPGWLRQTIRKNDRRESASKFLVVEASSREFSSYLAGHIPGAIHLDTRVFEQPPLWNVLPEKEIIPALIALGIHCNQKVVLYDREPFAASRAAQILMYIGVRDVRILEGGFSAWISAGYELETDLPKLQPVSEFGRAVSAHPEILLNLKQVSSLVTRKNTLLACVRNWEEHVGLVSGYDYIRPKGRIPGSIWAGEAGSSTFTNPDRTMRNHREIAAFWQSKGILPSQNIIFYCGTSWRASEVFLIAQRMGWKKLAVFDGGWLEWSAAGENPIETGWD